MSFTSAAALLLLLCSASLVSTPAAGDCSEEVLNALLDDADSGLSVTWTDAGVEESTHVSTLKWNVTSGATEELSGSPGVSLTLRRSAECEIVALLEVGESISRSFIGTLPPVSSAQPVIDKGIVLVEVLTDEDITEDEDWEMRTWPNYESSTPSRRFTWDDRSYAWLSLRDGGAVVDLDYLGHDDLGEHLAMGSSLTRDGSDGASAACPDILGTWVSSEFRIRVLFPEEKESGGYDDVDLEFWGDFNNTIVFDQQSGCVASGINTWQIVESNLTGNERISAIIHENGAMSLLEYSPGPASLGFISGQLSDDADEFNFAFIGPMVTNTTAEIAHAFVTSFVREGSDIVPPVPECVDVQGSYISEDPYVEIIIIDDGECTFHGFSAHDDSRELTPIVGAVLQYAGETQLFGTLSFCLYGFC